MEKSIGEGQVSRKEARRRRDEEFKKYMEEGRRKDEERLGAIVEEHEQKLNVAQVARDTERQEIQGGLKSTRQQLDELDRISKKLNAI